MVPRDPGVLFETYDAFGIERPRPADIMARLSGIQLGGYQILGSTDKTSSSNHGQGHQTEWGHEGKRSGPHAWKATRLPNGFGSQTLHFLPPRSPDVRSPSSEEGRKRSSRRRGTLNSDTL